MHGDKDSAVPFSQSVLRAEALKKAGMEVTIQPVKGAGHVGGEFYRTRKLWLTKTPAPQRIGTGVVVGKHVFMANENGAAQCIELKL